MTPTKRLADQSASLCALPFQHVDLPDLFYIHEISGSVLHFSSIARSLAKHRNVIGIQCIGLNAGFTADRTIEEMADRYLTVLDRRGSSSSYDIVGYSMGGLIAWEMACRLLEAGKPVRLLGLVDPPVPGSLGPLDEARVVRMMARTLRVGAVLTAETEDANELLARLVAGARSAGTVPASCTVDDFRPAVALQLINGRAAEIYRPRKIYPADMRLLSAGLDTLADKVDGWKPFVAGHIEGEAIDADHFSLFHGEGMKALTSAIERWVC
ncbi:thioesterase domain-containing protein [Amycolatopsis sp. NPDC054798]